MISLNNGLSWHAPADLDIAELERLWDALVNVMDPIAQLFAHSDLRWLPGDRVSFLELYLEHAGAGHRLAVG